MSNATQTFREVQRKANAGERIKIVAAKLSGGFYRNGDVFTVSRLASGTDGSVHVDKFLHRIWQSEYVVLEPIVTPTPNLPDLFAQFIRDNAGAVRSYLAEIDPVVGAEEAQSVAEVTQSLTRAKVIEMARERVAELERAGCSGAHGNVPPGSPLNGKFFTLKFRVNRERRTVVAEGIGKISGKRLTKAYAKCAPDDVFNADIGKAIAAERALGLTLTPAFVNAPKPEKAVAGVVIRKIDGAHIGTTRVVDRTVMNGKAYVFTNGYNSEVKNCAIIDDTDAVYEDAA